MHHNFAALSDSITSIGSQNSIILSEMMSTNSKAKDINTHITGVHKEMKRMEVPPQIRKIIEGSAFDGAELEYALYNLLRGMINGKTRYENLERSELKINHKQLLPTYTNRSGCRHAKTGAPTKIDREPLETKPAVESMALSPIQTSIQVPSYTRRELVKSTFGQYKTVVGTVSWQKRVTQIYREGGNSSETEHQQYETFIEIRPALWVLARRICVQLSSGFGGWKWNGRQNRPVPRDALIFEYCKIGNLAGVKDLLKHRLASPVDVDYFGRTPLHVRRHKVFGSKEIDCT